MERVCWSPSKIIGEHDPLPPTPSLATRTSYNLCSMLSSLLPEKARERFVFTEIAVKCRAAAENASPYSNNGQLYMFWCFPFIRPIPKKVQTIFAGPFA